MRDHFCLYTSNTLPQKEITQKNDHYLQQIYESNTWNIYQAKTGILTEWLNNIYILGTLIEESNNIDITNIYESMNIVLVAMNIANCTQR